MKEGTITISINEYISLRKDSEKLRLLENGGVDNWEWYGEALYPDDKNGENFNDIVKKIEEEFE